VENLDFPDKLELELTPLTYFTGTTILHEGLRQR